MAAIVVALALAGAATALAAARDPGVTAPAPERIARSAVHSVTNAPEADATGGAPWSAHRVSPDSTSALSETGVPETGVPETGVPETGVPETGVPETGVPSKAAAPPDSPTAPSLVQTGPVGADAVLGTVNSPALPEGPGLQVNAAARAARDAAGRNGAGPPAQAAPVTSFDITLSPGANLISLPLVPDDIGIEAVLTGILDRVETVWQYDTSGAVPRWRSYAPGAPSDLRVMRDGLGYWVLLKDGGAGDTVLTVTGREETGPARRVARGWNLVGFTSTVPQAPGEYLGALSGSAGTTMVGYAGGVAELVLPRAAPPQLMPGRGYWLYVESAGTIGGAPPETMAALVALYNATGGANWRNNGNWLSNAPIGAWHGVTTDSDGLVTHLSLYDNQLTGAIPAELGNLTNLEVLALIGNQLTGEIPAELGDLTNLEYLDLRSNQLTGEIPAELGSLTNLTHLYLYDNQLTGEIPAELGDLTNLTHLYLSGNQLTGEIPAELGDLTNLTELCNLYSNQLTGCIPEGLRNIRRNDFGQLGLPFCMPSACWRCGLRPGRPGRPLQRHGRSELGQQRQLAEQRPHGGMAWSNHRQRRPGHSSVPQRQPVDRGDTGGVGQPAQPGSASPHQPVDRGDTGGVGQPDQPDSSVPLRQPVDRGDTGGVGVPDQPGSAAARRQPVDRGDTGGVGAT